MAGGGSGEEGEFGLQIAPMLDILFVLLLFFMVSAGIQKKEGQLSTPLPGPGSPGKNTPLNIAIDSSDVVTFNGSPVDQSHPGREMPELAARLQSIVQESPDQPFVITPSHSATHQRVMDVLSACKGAKITKIALGTPSN